MYQIKPNGEIKDKVPFPDNILSENSKNKNNTDLVFIKLTDLPPPSPERLEELRQQVIHLKSLNQPAQRSPEWYNMRESMITASNWGAVLKQNKYSHKNAVVLQKCGHTGYQFKGNADTEWGKKYENAAIKIFERRNKTIVWEFGVIRHPTIEFLGASPDGITPDGVMVEIKCPPKRVITGEIPIHYWCQIQGQLEVCKLDRCDFLECKFLEYNSPDDHTFCDEYFNDNYNGDCSLTSNGVEKGVVIVMMDKKTQELSYIHGNIGINAEEYIIWKEKTVQEKISTNPDLIYVETSFWKLDRISCVPVFRDVKWFYQSLPRLRRCWEDIEYFRIHGLDKIVDKKERSKSTSTQISISKYFTQDTSSSDDEDSISTNNLNNYHDFKKFKGLNFFSSNKPPPPLPEESISYESLQDSPPISKKSLPMFSFSKSNNDVKSTKINITNKAQSTNSLIHKPPINKKPLVDTTSPVDKKPPVDTPSVDTLSVDTPSVDTPSVNTLLVDTPSVDTPSVDIKPSVDTPSVDTPSVDTPSVDTPSVDNESVTDITSLVVDNNLSDNSLMKKIMKKAPVKKPTVKKPTIKKTLVDKTVVDKTVVDKTVVDENMVDESVVNKNVIGKSEVGKYKCQSYQDIRDIMLEINNIQDKLTKLANRLENHISIVDQ
jgi:putative phage-type endonuclease